MKFRTHDGTKPAKSGGKQAQASAPRRVPAARGGDGEANIYDIGDHEPEEFVLGEIAGAFPRLIAFILDLIFISIPLGGAIYVAHAKDMAGWDILVPGGIVAWILYFSLTQGMAQASPGMKVVGIRLQREKGGDIGVGRTLARAVIFLPFFWLNAPLAAFTAQKQGLHDLFTDMLVTHR
jgi:uncharacterized RDD family membrane protein YckC